MDSYDGELSDGTSSRRGFVLQMSALLTKTRPCFSPPSFSPARFPPPFFTSPRCDYYNGARRVYIRTLYANVRIRRILALARIPTLLFSVSLFPALPLSPFFLTAPSSSPSHGSFSPSTNPASFFVRSRAQFHSRSHPFAPGRRLPPLTTEVVLPCALFSAP